MDPQQAKAAAKRLYKKVNVSEGPLASYEICSLLIQTYEYLKIPFKPNTNDIKEYAQILDNNKDGQVTLHDLQSKAIQYLCGPGVLKPQLSTSNNINQIPTTNNINTPSNNSNHSQMNSFQQKNSSQNNAVNTPLSVKKEHYPSPPANPAQSPVRDQPVHSAQRQYNNQTMQYISLIKQIFESHASQYGTITQHKVPVLLAETYEVLGQKGYQASNDDVRIWMQICDENQDGHVEFEQYCYFVLQQLEESGYEIYK